MTAADVEFRTTMLTHPRARATVVLSGLRLWLRRKPGINQRLQAARALVHFGPWRHLFRAAIRWWRPPVGALPNSSTSLLGDVDVAHVVRALHRDSVHVVGRLPDAFVARVRAVTDKLPLDHYGDFDARNADVRALSRDPSVLEVLRAYFGSEPELLECTVVVHEAVTTPAGDVCPQRRFHFDYAGWQSLNLFVYLTDVDEDSSAHEVAAGSHRLRTLRDALRAFLSDEETARRFGSSIRRITGPAGTAFFENTEAFHRRGESRRRRVLLNMLFASHRGLLSRGRNVPPLAHYLDRDAASPRA